MIPTLVLAPKAPPFDDQPFLIRTSLDDCSEDEELVTAGTEENVRLEHPEPILYEARGLPFRRSWPLPSVRRSLAAVQRVLSCRCGWTLLPGVGTTH